MKSRRFSLAIAFALSLSVVYLFVLSSLMKTGTAAPASAENTLFKGKVVMVQLEDKYGVALGHAQIRQLGDRTFVVGKGSDEGDPANWTKGRMTWVPMNRIIQIVEFESEEDMKKAREDYQKNALPPPPQQAGQPCSP